MTEEEQKELYNIIYNCVGSALEALGEDINKLSIFTQEEFGIVV